MFKIEAIRSLNGVSLYFFPKRLSLNFHQKMINNLKSVPNVGATKVVIHELYCKKFFQTCKRA
ncbi:hypothetical protein [Leptospira santarosai]|uniref:hypothetical protein n=1 Tax=Leptospira santarosai TaxID=28183 RepID=UPI0002BDEF53|nr:hypothetical protein [Leptospira santarosai]EMO32190.1 hypothetical protein LEP1GSC175_0555 [Leptospira santarosai str. HAI821]EMP80183.1 hypothetical protein LEP1GSC162_2965 [Leptospira santarosai str. CBC1531]MDI7156665.1 hypothetical protein [Leptospira santarosai]